MYIHDPNWPGEELPADRYDEIVQAYLDGIALPDEKRAYTCMLCLAGLVGTGKTTLARRFGRLGFVRLSTDEIREVLKERGYNANCAYLLASQAMARLLQAGHPIVFDADGAGRYVRQTVLEMSGAHAVPGIWVTLSASKDVVIARLEKARNGDRHISVEKASALYDRRQSDHLEFRRRFGSLIVYDFDTSTGMDDLDRQFAEALKAIEERVGLFRSEIAPKRIRYVIAGIA